MHDKTLSSWWSACLLGNRLAMRECDTRTNWPMQPALVNDPLVLARPSDRLTVTEKIETSSMLPTPLQNMHLPHRAHLAVGTSGTTIQPSWIPSCHLAHHQQRPTTSIHTRSQGPLAAGPHAAFCSSTAAPNKLDNHTNPERASAPSNGMPQRCWRCIHQGCRVVMGRIPSFSPPVPTRPLPSAR